MWGEKDKTAYTYRVINTPHKHTEQRLVRAEQLNLLMLHPKVFLFQLAKSAARYLWQARHPCCGGAGRWKSPSQMPQRRRGFSHPRFVTRYLTARRPRPGHWPSLYAQRATLCCGVQRFTLTSYIACELVARTEISRHVAASYRVALVSFSLFAFPYQPTDRTQNTPMNCERILVDAMRHTHAATRTTR